VPVQIPIGAEDTFTGLIDLMDMKAYTFGGKDGEEIIVNEIPANMKDEADEARTNMLDAIASTDDDLADKFLMEEEITIEELKAALRKACINVEIIPVFCGSAYRKKGVQKLLDGVLDYLPAPTDVDAIKGIVPGTDEEVERKSDDKEPFSALAFKVVNDAHVGKLIYFRVYSGTFESGNYVYNVTKDKKERISRIFLMHSSKREEIDKVYAGDIAAAVGLKSTTTGDTLCIDSAPVVLESMNFPEPVIHVAIEPKTKAGRDKLSLSLSKLAEEDPTFKTYTDDETGQTIIPDMV